MNFPPLGPPAFANFPKENGLQTITCRTVRAEGPQALGPLPVTQQVVLKLPEPGPAERVGPRAGHGPHPRAACPQVLEILLCLLAF